MALEVGGRVGHFDVLSPIGAGGMGEVYRARDTRLGRDVALKVLPQALAQDVERRARLEREARALAALNHPGIATIHGLEEHEGRSVLVMELVEGETLEKRLARGRLPLRRAVDVGRQIAEALGAAHEKGIIHRDLKPSNVNLTPDGYVKLLDFGLAKALAAAGADSGEPEMSSSSTGSTATGVVLGTAPYMSPEQVRGEALDRGTDIWSFGCVLYELLAGGRAFPGRGPETVAAILEREPEWQALPPDTPVKVQQLLRRCLQKDRGRRLHDIADARIELDEALAESTTGPAPSTAPVVPPARLRRRLWLVPLVLAVLAGTHASLFLWGRRTGEAPIPAFTRVTFRRGVVDSARFSSDGHTVVYSARWGGAPAEVYSQRLGSADARPFGLAGARVVATAGAEMAVILQNGTLARVPLEGGPPREVLGDVNDADWTRDGGAFAVVRNLEQHERLEYPIGTALFQTTSEIEHIASPRLSPAGDRIAFLHVMHPATGTASDLVVADLSGKTRVLSKGWQDAGGVSWSADGREVWFTATRIGRNRALRAVAVSGEERVAVRVPGRLVLQDVEVGGRALLTTEQVRWELRGRLAGDTSERDLSWLDGTTGGFLSADASQVVIEEWGEGGGVRSSTYIRRADGSPPVRLGPGEVFDVSPDWKWVLCGVGSPIDLVLVPIGAGQPRTLPRGSIRNYYRASWSPDGRRIVVRGMEAGRPLRLFVQDLPDGVPRAFSPEGVGGYSWVFSADGRWFAARPPGNQAPFVFYPLDGGPPRPIPGIALRGQPIARSQSADGRRLFVMSPGAGLPARVSRLDLRSGRQEPWLEFAPVDRAGVSDIPFYTVNPDGRHYAYGYKRTLSDLYLVDDLQ